MVQGNKSGKMMRPDPPMFEWGCCQVRKHPVRERSAQIAVQTDMAPRSLIGEAHPDGESQEVQQSRALLRSWYIPSGHVLQVSELTPSSKWPFVHCAHSRTTVALCLLVWRKPGLQVACVKHLVVPSLG